MFDWNDVKALLAVARGGSTAAAARELGVNQTTVARRLEALERDLGARLVERHQAGADLTEVGRALVAEAETMERAAQAMRQTLEVHRRGVAGTLRVTMSEMTANADFMPMLPEFRALHPDLLLEVVITDERLDIEAGEADVAIRGAFSLPDSTLVARKSRRPSGPSIAAATTPRGGGCPRRRRTSKTTRSSPLTATPLPSQGWATCWSRRRRRRWP